MNVIAPKKLIEVALPLDAINDAAKEEKAVPRRGHPQTLHYWWARRPLAAARAVIFAQLVNDPEDLWRCQNPGQEPNQQVRGHWTKVRAKLFKIIEDLVLWENTTNETVLSPAREAIRQSWLETCELNKNHPQAKELFRAEKMPGLHDPFAGGGTIPLEAQRLGLTAFATDLNPVSVLINKAMIEIPPLFADDRAPVHPESKNPMASWCGAAGLAEDVRHYGAWMRDEASKRIGQFYPRVSITSEIVKDRSDLRPYEGEELTVIAWMWARTVRSPSPAFAHVEVPLASSFILGSKDGNDCFVTPVFHNTSYFFRVAMGKAPAEARTGTTAGKRAAFLCVMSRSPIDYDYIRKEGQAGRMGQKLMAIVAEGTRGRVYLSPTPEQEAIAASIEPKEKLELQVPDNPRDYKTPNYGMMTFGDLFTARQLMALTTFSDLITEVKELVRRDASASFLSDRTLHFADSDEFATSYSNAVALYLSCAISRMASYNNTICYWNIKGGSVGQIFARQSVRMSWDFIEVNPLEQMSGNWTGGVQWISDVLGTLRSTIPGHAQQADASRQAICKNCIISTDPPYYDNIAYADLSDFFYVWLRRSLRTVYPALLATIAVPKEEELVAAPHRHGSRQKAEKFFLDGMTKALINLAKHAHPSCPITIYYAFKQSETESREGTSSTGWETFLEALKNAGLVVTGTWPMRTERISGVKVNTNVLASSIVLVCRPRMKDAGTISRRQFVRMLNETLPLALDAMTRESEGLHSPVAPVDLSQAIIGPGMAIFSRYDAVLEADGKPMTVRTALQLINRFLAEDDFDADTQFCLHWFEQHGWEPGKFGEADTLARAKGTAVSGVQQAGVIESGGGNVRLLKWKEYPGDWDPRTDTRLPVWEALHQLIRAYNTEGDRGAAVVFKGVEAKAEAARQLAYRLYTLCERRGWAEDARAYNEVVTGWSGIESAAVKVPAASQGTLFDNEGEK